MEKIFCGNGKWKWSNKKKIRGKKRKGRPHKGDVKDRESQEDHVHEKVAIFRKNKKFYA